MTAASRQWPLLLRAGALGLAALALPVGCGKEPAPVRLTLEPHGKTCEVVIKGAGEIGDMRLWVPEGIMSVAGGCAIYPVGTEWTQAGDVITHHVSPEGNLGPGNAILRDPNTYDLVGIPFPREGPVEWDTRVEASETDVRFRIRATNRGDAEIHGAGAAICLKFFNGDWWSDDRVWVQSGGEPMTLAMLGRDAGPPNGFEAYLLKGKSFDNVFYQQFWGFNHHRLDLPVMISEHPSGWCIGISGPDGVFLHSNLHNPCTDIMLSFGDIRPGETEETSGRVWLRKGKAVDLLRRMAEAG